MIHRLGLGRLLPLVGVKDLAAPSAAGSMLPSRGRRAPHELHRHGTEPERERTGRNGTERDGMPGTNWTGMGRDRRER